MIEGIVFDLWNTLARNTRSDPMRLLARAAGIDGEAGWSRRIERGMMLAPADGLEGGLRQLRRREGLAVEPAPGLAASWTADGVELFPEVRGTLARLRKRYRLGLCSNTQSFGLEFLEREGIWEMFDASALSFEVGALKPRREIFDAISRRLALAPDRLLMVGDKAGDDVKGARAAGMHGLLLRRGGHHDGDGVVDDLSGLPERVQRLNAAG